MSREEKNEPADSHVDLHKIEGHDEREEEKRRKEKKSDDRDEGAPKG